MESFSLNGKVRGELGRKAAKQLRKEERVPCNLYGISGNISFSVAAKEVKHLIYTDKVYKVALNIDGTERTAILKEIQFEPVSDLLNHIDFLELVDNKAVKVEVPIKLMGTAAGVKTGGSLITKLRLAKIKATPENLPACVEVNVETLEVGGLIRVRDIETKNFEILNAPSVVVATVKGKKGS